MLSEVFLGFGIDKDNRLGGGGYRLLFVEIPGDQVNIIPAS